MTDALPDRPSQAASTSARLHSPGLFAAIAVALVLQGLFAVSGVLPVLDGALIDPDAYMRLNRVRHLWESGAWFETTYPRINPPEGHDQHWTRPLDILLLVGALIASPFAGFAAALHWSGVLISPVLLVATLVAASWAMRPLVRADRAWLVAVLLLCQPVVFSYTTLGRADHHSLLLLLFVLILGLAVRMLLEPRRRAAALAAGALSALALWVSIEMLPLVAACFAALGLLWLAGARPFAPLAAACAAALLAGLAVALFVERGPHGYGAVEFDRLSVAHLGLFAASLLFWSVLSALQRRDASGGIAGRAASAAILACLLLAGLWRIWPGLFVSPFGEVDELYRQVRLARIVELQPLFQPSATGAFGWRELVANPLVRLGLALPAIPWLLFLLARPGTERRGWLVVALTTLAFLPLAIAQGRWQMFAEAVLVFPCARLLSDILDRVERARFPTLPRRIVFAGLVILAAVWFYLPATLSGGPAHHAATRERAASCPLKSVAEFLGNPAGLGAEPKLILAHVDYGSQLLYRTPHAVLAIPNHRRQPGFTLSYRLMTTTDAASAERLVRDHRIDLILLCAGSKVEADYYGTNPGDGSFHQLLLSDRVPGYLEAVPLPPELAPSFRLFAVRPAG